MAQADTYRWGISQSITFSNSERICSTWRMASGIDPMERGCDSALN